MSIPNTPLLTQQRIREQIAALREARQAIIDKCVEKDENGEYFLLTEGYKVVSPNESEVVISNGAFND
jgi:hypothetical protein